jgi:hypothetical protein
MAIFMSFGISFVPSKAGTQGCIDMSSAAHFAGGCLCGHIRYEATAQPVSAGYCHCRMCQRSSGAPAQVWAQFPIEFFRYTTAEPEVYKSSSWGERRFCPQCGSQLEFRLQKDPATVDLNVPTLDDPGAVQPSTHIWTKDQLPWFETTDDLPRHSDEGEAD